MDARLRTGTDIRLLDFTANPDSRPVAIALDTVRASDTGTCLKLHLRLCISIQKGPEIRTGLMKDNQDVSDVLELIALTRAGYPSIYSMYERF